MRSRILKPGFFKNEGLGLLGPYAQLLFEGLWCLADRQGKLEDRPARIKAEIFPYYEPSPPVDELLNSLFKSEEMFIERYMVDGVKYIKIWNFSNHQYPNSKETESKIPDPESNKHSKESNKHSKLRNEHSRQNLDNSIRYKGIKYKEGGVGGGDFDRFWEIYPTRNGKKIGKKECFEFFKKIPCNEIPSLLIATEHYARSKTVTDGYAKDPIRFLKKDFWKDWLEPPEQELPSYLRGCKDFLDHAEQEPTEDGKDQ